VKSIDPGTMKAYDTFIFFEKYETFARASGMTKSDQRDIAIDLACQSLGRLIKFWGFKEVIGKVWTLLYLSEGPLSAPEISQRLSISSGACSMTLNELDRLGLIERAMPGKGRKILYEPVTNIWRIATTILSEREDKELGRSLRNIRRALLMIEDLRDDGQLRRKLRELAGFILITRLGLRLFTRTGVLNVQNLRYSLGEGKYSESMKSDHDLQQLWEEDA